MLTLQKDKINGRINLRKILSLDEILNKPYAKVTIELKENYNIEEIKNLLSLKRKDTNKFDN